jgi:hypothetical protein
MAELNIRDMVVGQTSEMVEKALAARQKENAHKDRPLQDRLKQFQESTTHGIKTREFEVTQAHS